MTKKAYRKALGRAMTNREEDELNDLRTSALNRVEFTAQRRVRSRVLPWVFDPGDRLIAITPASEQEIDSRAGGRGPWGWGGYTSRYIASIAIRYENPQMGEEAPA